MYLKEVVKSTSKKIDKFAVFYTTLPQDMTKDKVEQYIKQNKEKVKI